MSEPLTDKELVDTLCEIDRGLSDWEVDFVESIAKQVEQHRSLSEKQRAIANRIMSKLARVPRGRD
jgi:hypothetical protein